MSKLLLTISLTILSTVFTPIVDAHVSTVVIKMTANGFEPREVTIDENSIINFANKDTVDRWPASNVHPTHELYGNLDPKKPIAPGDFWIFKAQQVGIWKIHDHLSPHKRGTITIVAEEKSDSATAPDTDRSSNPEPTHSNDDSIVASTLKETSWRTNVANFFSRIWRALTSPFRSKNNDASTNPTNLDVTEFQLLAEQQQYDYLNEMSASQSLDEVWTFVKSTYTNDAGAALGGRAHDLAHFTGSLMHAKQGLSALALCDTTFAFGCYHGFTEAAFKNSLEPLEPIAIGCVKLGPVGSGPWSSCIHGIGHGVATYYDAVELDNALATCDKIKGATFCHDGVFMEFSFSAPPNFYQADDPLYPCSDLDGRYQQACGRNQPNIMRTRLNFDTATVAKYCASDNPDFTAACVSSIGHTLAGQVQGNPSTAISGCQVFDDPAQHANCATAAAEELVFQNFAGWQQTAPAICNQLEAKFQSACHQKVQRTAQNYSR